MSELRIRNASAVDVPLILQFIRDLADFEQLSEEVVATEESIRTSLFGENPRAEVLIAESAEGSAGFAIFFHNYSTFLGRSGIYLEDLFVRPKFRGRGHGKALFARLARIALERGCQRLEWSVLNWNQDAIAFYRSLGALPMDQWTTYRLKADSLRALALADR